MEDKKNKSRKKTVLRRQAEKKLKDQGAEFEELTPEKSLRLVHELRVHQVELEIQNDELRQTQVRLEEARSRYSDLYDFAPVSYFTLDESGRILGANLTAASLLGVERGLLSGKLFLQFVALEDMGVFGRFLPKVLESENRASCEVRLKDGFGEVEARLDGLLWQDTGGERHCRVTVTDISNLRATERELRRHRDHLEQLVLERTASLEEAVQKLRHEMAERRQAEAEIKRMASFPQLNPSPVLEIDVTGAITYYNQAAVAAVENSGAEARLKDFLPDDLEEIQTAARQRREGSFYREVSIADAVFAEHIYFAAPFDVLRVYAVDITTRKQVEEDLRQSEARHRSFFQDSHAVMLVLDPKTGVIVDANPAACFFYGYTKEELTARQITDINTMARDQVFDEMQRAGTGECRQFSFRHRLANGEVRDVEVFSGPVQFHGKTLLFSIIHDVTARKHAEEALQRQQEELQIILDSVPAMIFYKDKENRFILTNKALAEAMGLPKEEMDGKSVFDLYPSKADDYWKDDQEVMRSSNPKRNIVETLETPAGVRWVQTDKIPYRDDRGNIIGVIGFSVDITERKRAEEALRRAHDELEQRVLERTAELRLAVEHLQEEITQRQQAEEGLDAERQRLIAVLERIPAYVVLISPDCRMPFANREFIRRFGDPGDRLCYDFLFGIDAPCEGCNALKVFKTNTPELWEWTGPDGNTYQIYDHPFTDVDGSPLVLEMGVEITARKEAERLIQRQSDILAGINRIFRQALICETEEDLGRTCLAVLEDLTGAQLGLIYDLNPEGRLAPIAISNPGWAACKMAGTSEVRLHRHLHVRGLYRSVVEEGKSLIANEPASHPDSIGVPEGHPPLTEFLGVPLKYGDKVMGVICLGNKAGGFDPADQEKVETLSVAIVEALMRLRAEKQATSIGRLYRVLSKVNEAIVRAQDRETLFGQICRVVVEEGRFRMAWIGLVDQEEGSIKAVAQYGSDEGYLERFRIPLRDAAECRGPIGTAVREGKYDVCNDIANDPRTSPWREEALARGYRSAGSFALRVGSEVIGSLSMYAGKPGFFTDEEISLLENLALDVSFAMESLEREGKRRQAEAALKESEERLRSLASQLIHAQETERKRISLELHDDLGQILTVLKLQVREIDKGLPSDFRELRECCADLRNNLDEVIEKMRHLSRDLSPSILIDLGLPAALRHLTEEFSKYHDIKLSLKMDHIKNQFTAEEEINLYRIFQEALNNIVKHARATRIGITIKKHKGQVTFRVDDNGRGFDRRHILAKDASSRGLGLAAVEERVRMLGGTLEISSQEAKGTSITFVVPVRA
jgi:PAS domain S-box-containing protein